MHQQTIQLIITLILLGISGLAWWRLRLKKIAKYNSPKLGSIEVVKKYNGEKLLTINTYAQGVSIEQKSIKKSYWYAIAKNAVSLSSKNPEILMLGLGANTISNLIEKLNPKARQTIVEFDEDIVKACREHFQLNDLKNVDLIETDAYKLLDKKKAFAKKFDCIIVDIFTGKPPYVSLKSNQPTFIQKLIPYLKSDGSLLFNRPGNTEAARADSKRLEEDLQKIFKETRILDIRDPRGYRNNIVIASDILPLNHQTRLKS